MKRTWKRCAVPAALIAALSAGTAWADTYTSAADGKWTAPAADGIDTWGAGLDTFPGAGDEAVITGGFTVTGDAAIDPAIISVSIATNGTLLVNPVATLTAPWLMDGGTILFARDDGYIAGTVTVNSASTFDVQSIWNYDGSRISATITDGASTTGVLTKTGDGTLWLEANNSGFSGGCDVTSGQISASVDGALGTGTMTLRSGTLLRVSPTTTIGPSTLVMEDNTRLDIGGDYTVGAIQASGTVTINCWRNNQTEPVTSDISGSGTLILTCSSAGGNGLSVGGDNSGYTGDILIDAQSGSKTVSVTNANALGTNAAGGLVTVKSGSNLSIGPLATGTLERDVTLENGSSLVTSSSSTRTLTGTLTLQSGQASIISPRGNNHTSTLNIDGQITGDGGVLYTSNDQWPYNCHRRVTVSNAANDYAGGTVIDDVVMDYNGNANYREGGRDNYVRVTNNGALSTGTVSVLAGALWTDPAAGSGTAVLDSVVGPVTFQGGTFMLGSTETKQVALAETGALRVMAGTPTLDYTPTTGQFQIYHNAILDKASVVDAALALPSASDIQGAAAQNQVLLGLRANHADEGWFGPGAGGNGGGSGAQIWGGLGTTDYSFSLTGTVHEYTAGEGFTLGAQKGRQLSVSAGASLDATGAISLAGDGNFIFAGTPIVDQTGAINKSGAGLIQFSNTGGLPAGKTLNVNGGYLDVDAADAIAGTVEINAAASFRVDQDITTGAINVNAGGAIHFGSDARVASGAAFTFDPNSQIILAGNNLAMPGGTEGVVDVILTHRDNDDYAGGIVLGDNTRLTHATNYDWNNVTADLQTGEVSSTGTQARLAAQDGYTLQIASKVNLPGKNLIIGDVNDFATFNRSGTAAGTISQDGTVYLTNTTNAIGTIDIQAGTLALSGSGPGYYDTSKLGGATAIRIAAGATLAGSSAWSTTWPLNAVVSGNGTIAMRYVNNNGGPSGVRFIPAWTDPVLTESALAPGDGAGTINIIGPLSFGKVDVSPDASGDYRYGQFRVEAMGDGGVAGTDHDLAAVTGNATLTDGEVVVSLPLPGAGLKPSTPNWGTPDPDDVVVGNLGDMTVLTAATVNGTFAVETIGATIGVDADPGTPGLQPDYHYMLATGAVLADYSNGTDVVVKGADILWMALPGDANLDDSCDVSDLSLLAGSYRQSGTWLQGDFNFDGNVDVSDLSLLAGNFRTSNPYFTPGSGGSPVPEPVTLVLLGLGGLGLVARRRRK